MNCVPSGIPYMFHVYVLDIADSPVEGLVQGDFNVTIVQDGTERIVAYTISEVGKGFYAVILTPPAGYGGHWVVSLDVPSYQFVWDETFLVQDVDLDVIHDHLRISSAAPTRLILYVGTPADISLNAVRRKDDLSTLGVLDEFGNPLAYPIALTLASGIPGYYWTDPLTLSDTGDVFFEFETSSGQKFVRDGTIYASSSVIHDDIEPPTNVDVCRVYGWLFDGTATPIENAECIFITHPVEGTGFAVGETTTVVLTDTEGFFQVDLLRRTVVSVIVRRASIHRPIYVPDLSTADFTTLS